MAGKQEIETVYRLWKVVCELQNLLFDHYGEYFMDLYLLDQIEKANTHEEVDWPF